MQRDEGSLEVGSYAQSGDDLEDYDFGPGSGGAEIDVEAETDGHQKGAEPDWFSVAACFADEDAHGGGEEGHADYVGESVDS